MDLNNKTPHKGKSGKGTKTNKLTAGMAAAAHIDTVIYFGDRFLKGSSVCALVAEDGRVSLPQFFWELIKDDAIGTYLVEAENSGWVGEGSSAMEQVYPASIVTSTADMSHEVLRSESVSTFKNIYSLIRFQEGKQQYFHQQYQSSGLEASNWLYPYYRRIRIARGLQSGAGNKNSKLNKIAQLSHVCQSVDVEKMSADVSAGILPAYSEVDLWAMRSIFNKGFGCNSCKSSSGRTGTDKRFDRSSAGSGEAQTYAYITSPGYDGLPTYADMKSERILLNRHCEPYPGGRLYAFEYEEE